MIFTRAVLRGLREKDPKAEVCYPVFTSDKTLPKRREEGVFLSCSAEALEKQEVELFRLFSPEDTTASVADWQQMEDRQEYLAKFHSVVLTPNA